MFLIAHIAICMLALYKQKFFHQVPENSFSDVTIKDRM